MSLLLKLAGTGPGLGLARPPTVNNLKLVYKLDTMPASLPWIHVPRAEGRYVEVYRDTAAGPAGRFRLFEMPLAPAFRFEQDEESCTVFVSLTSAAAATRNTRVYCTDACVQVTCPPYFLQLDLFADIDSSLSTTKITPGLATIKVFKRTHKIWDQLLFVGSPQEVKARRDLAKKERDQLEAKALEDSKEKKRQDEDYVFHKQWDLEKDEKRTIERQAALHKRSAEQDLESWIAEKEGKSPGNATSSEPLVTYFDRQLVEDSSSAVLSNESEDPEAVPLPAAYNAKTARTSVLQHASKKDPVRAFDIREPKAKPAAADQELLPPPPPQEQEPVQTASSASAKLVGDAEDTGGNHADSAQNLVAAAENGCEPARTTATPTDHEGTAASGAQEPGRRSGASVNRWEAEKIARSQLEAARTVAARGFPDIAEQFLRRARDAAPWLHEDLVLTPAEIPALPSRPGDPPPRAPARVEVAFSQGRRSLPARERLETDEEAAEREAEDRRAKEREGRSTSGPVDEQVLATRPPPAAMAPRPRGSVGGAGRQRQAHATACVARSMGSGPALPQAAPPRPCRPSSVGGGWGALFRMAASPARRLPPSPVTMRTPPPGGAGNRVAAAGARSLSSAVYFNSMFNLSVPPPPPLPYPEPRPEH